MKKIGCFGWFAILIIFGLGLGAVIKIYIIDKKRAQENVQGKEIVVNSSLDGSVKQVQTYLKNSVNDWDSYESIEWSPVRKVPASTYDFVVRHKFRTKNGFGGMVLNDKIFYLDAAGEVVNVEEYK